MARNAGNSALALVKTIERNGGVLEDDWDSEHGRVGVTGSILASTV